METNDNGIKENKDSKNAWMQEIINETDHYFQGEMQQDQRASWILATASALIALLVGLQISAPTQSAQLARIFIFGSAGAYFISAVIAIFVMLPLRGIGSFWGDLFGINLRKVQKKKIHDLIKERFRHDDKWSQKSFESRLKYHFRSHYIRNSKKAYGIIWASIFLLIGLLASATAVVLINL